MMITKKQIREALQKFSSCEPYNGGIAYYLHITHEGRMVGDRAQADETFAALLDQRAYASMPDDYDWRDEIEVDGNEYFEKLIDELYERARDYLA